MNEKPPFYLVWSPQGRAPTYKHPDYASAETEAKRLAREHKGMEFFILCPFGSYLASDVIFRKFDLDEIPF